MRTAREVPASDLTTQAKIRDAGIAHFARDGFHKASLRAIAATAGVSAALVIHHFGSKEGLRLACDDHILGMLIRRARDKQSPAGLQGVLRGYLADPGEYQRDLDYLARALAEDSDTARQFIDTMVDESEAIIRSGIADGSMRESADPRALAALIAMTSLAYLTMRSHLQRVLAPDGEPERRPDGRPDDRPDLERDFMRRLALPAIELYTYGLYTDDSYLTVIRDALAADAQVAAGTTDTPAAQPESKGQ